MSRHNPADSVSRLQRTAMNSHHPRRRALLLGGLGLPFASLTPLLAGAQVAWPNRSITLIAPNAPGGPADTLARAVANGMSKILNVPVVVENKPGASGKIGIQALLRAPRDGYTLAVTSETALSALPMFDKNVGYQFCRFRTVVVGGSHSRGLVRAPVGAGEQSARIGGLCQGQSGQAQLRQLWQQQLVAPGLGEFLSHR